MLYDEEGRAYVEPPLLPEDAHVFWIVSDYQRMFQENNKLLRKNDELRETINHLNGYQFALNRIIVEQKKMMDRMIGMLKKNGIDIPSDIKNFKVTKY